KSMNGLPCPDAMNQSGFDLFQNSMVHAKAAVGLGTLINAGASIHHEVHVGKFCDIGPGAVLLGKAVVGDACEIGRGAIILPNVVLGNRVVVGAGVVVSKDFGYNLTIKGIPAKNKSEW